MFPHELVRDSGKSGIAPSSGFAGIIPETA
jgi:hypothetical protein